MVVERCAIFLFLVKMWSFCSIYWSVLVISGVLWCFMMFSWCFEVFLTFSAELFKNSKFWPKINPYFERYVSTIVGNSKLAGFTDLWPSVLHWGSISVVIRFYIFVHFAFNCSLGGSRTDVLEVRTWEIDNFISAGGVSVTIITFRSWPFTIRS